MIKITTSSSLVAELTVLIALDYFLVKLRAITACKVSVFGVILVRLLPHSDWIWTRITLNTDTFYAVYSLKYS